MCVGFLGGFPAEAFAESLVELIVHLLDPRGADAVQWGPLGKVLAQQAVGVLIGAASQGQRALQKWTGAPSGSWRAGPGANSWPRSTVRGRRCGGPGPARLSSETSTARLEGALPPTRHHLVARPRRGDL